MRARLRFVVCTLLCATSLQAAETITYSYDARGRIVQAARSGDVNNGVSACYAYDKADNRTNVTVAASNCGAIPPVPGFTVSGSSTSEGSGLIFTVSRSGSTAGAMSVNYATANGSAIAGSDYTAGSGTLSFASGEAAKTVTIATTDDALVESAETLTLNLSGATGGATIPVPQAVGTINDNDVAETPPAFAINDVSVTEGGSLVLTVTKTGTVSSSYSVSFATANGTATAGSDYTAASSTLAFAAADTTKTVTVATIDDAVVEAAETVGVNLSGATGGATISDAQGIGTINDNDTAATCSGISFQIGNAGDVEGNGLVFTVTRTGSTSISCSVSYASANGTAVAPGDYTAVSGTLTFAASQSSRTISITTLVNGPGEGDETMYVNLSNATGGATISDSQGLGTLYNWVDDGGGGGDPCPIVC